MPGAKLHVRKQGKVFTIFVDENKRPLPIASHDDKPAGGIPFTCVGEGELRTLFPGFEYEFHEKPTQAPPIITRDKSIRDEAATLLKKMSRSKTASEPMPTQTPPTQTKTPCQTRAKAEEFLKRLEFANKYASEENQVTLAVQISIVQELLDEVFGQR